MKLLVTGVKGQLGHDIVNECNNRNIEAVGVDVEEMDITDAGKVAEVIKSGNYNAVIHCAAWTAVDKAEDEVELCTKVNVDGTRNIANICKELDIPMMYFSTDYVFDGQGETEWKEYDERHPLNVYGQTKYEGELIVETLPKHFIVRIAWVFGINGYWITKISLSRIILLIFIQFTCMEYKLLITFLGLEKSLHGRHIISLYPSCFNIKSISFLAFAPPKYSFFCCSDKNKTLFFISFSTLQYFSYNIIFIF